MLHDCNQHVKQFKFAAQTVPNGNNLRVVIHADKKPSSAHRGCFNTPTVSENFIVIEGQTFEKRDRIIIRRKDDIKRIWETHVAYGYRQYTLMFPYGEDMHSINVPLCVTCLPSNKMVT